MTNARTPDWVTDYVGLPFAEHGRSRAGGLDCYGLVRLYFLEQRGVSLPSLADLYADSADAGAIADTIASQTGALGRWKPVGTEAIEEGDVLIFRVGAAPMHMGIALPGWLMLHALRDVASCVEPWRSPTWLPRLHTALRHAGAVNLRVSALATGSSGPAIELPEGLTIAEMIAASGMPDLDELAVRIERKSVPREHWGRVRPLAGRHVHIYAVPRGGRGGKNPLRIILTIAVIVAAIAIPAALELGAVAAGLLSAGISIGGTLAINALIPAPRPQIGAATGDTGRISPSITSSRNENRVWSPIPIPFGDIRFAPPFGAIPYTEIVGDDQYLRELFLVGYGEVLIDEHRIGPSDVASFTGLEMEVRSGVAGDAPITLYPGTVIEQALAIQLCPPSGVAFIRTSDRDADELSVDLLFPKGLAMIKADGTNGTVTAGVLLRVRPYSSALGWVTVPGPAPETKSEMDAIFVPANLYGTGTLLKQNMQWGRAFPDPVPVVILGGDGIANAWEFTASFTKPSDLLRNYLTLAIDCSDAGEVYVNNVLAASWYGTHGTLGGATPDFTQHKAPSGQLAAGVGANTIKIRLYSRYASQVPTQPALAIGWYPDVIGGSGTSFEVAPLISWLTTDWTVKHYTAAANWTISNNITEAFRRAIRFVAPGGRDQYDVLMQVGITSVYTGTLLSDIYWTTLRTIRSEDPVKIGGMARVAMRVKASEQLSGVVDEYNCRVRSILLDWNGAVWTRRATSNPAAIFREMLQGRGARRPLADARLDLLALQAWHEECHARGWTFNAVLDFAGTLWERLRDVAAAGRATPCIRDGLFSVVRDRAQSVPVQMFTPRNSWGFKANLAYTSLPHALRVRFLNGARGFEQDELIVLADGYTIDGLDARGVARPDLPPATAFDSLEMFGSTTRRQVWEHGRYYLAVAYQRPTVYELNASVDHLVCQRGDLVHVAHDVLQSGTVWGRVLAVGMQGDRVDTLTLDEPVQQVEGAEYGVRLRLADGTVWTSPLQADYTLTRTIKLGMLPPAGVGTPAVGDLAVLGPLTSQVVPLIVKAIEVDQQLNGKLTLVDAAPDVLTADTSPPASVL